MIPAARRPSIMIVDDEPMNLRLLEGMLRRKGYEVRSFPLGRLALAAAANQPPDLILLDVSMPELTGYEVCERLKSDPLLAAIPVIFLSALQETEDKVRAFRSGGEDYISKPFQFEEVYARIETQLKVYDLQRALKIQIHSLEEAVASRTRQLAEANARLTMLDRAKDDFLKIISHELRTPLNGLFGVGEFVLTGLSDSPENNELREMFEGSRQRILMLVNDALLLTQIDVQGEKFRSDPVSLSGALSCAIEMAAGFAESRNVALELSSVDLGLVRGEQELLASALHALLDTAVKFSEEGGAIRLSREIIDDTLRLIIESDGRTIPGPRMAKFFDVFSISEAITPGGDLGLGPPLACRILALFGATVSVENREPPGIRLTVSFKKDSAFIPREDASLCLPASFVAHCPKPEGSIEDLRMLNQC
jgi:CheY-like chemotaxis protein